METNYSELILIRHAQAESRVRGYDDALRKLTGVGIENTKKILPKLKEYLNASGEVQLYTSNKLRSIQMAEIIATTLNIKQINKKKWVDSNCTKELFEALRSGHADTVMIVGHEPFLSEWSRALCDCEIPFKKGQAVGFLITYTKKLQAVPAWIVNPDAVSLKELNVIGSQSALKEFKKYLYFLLQEIVRMQYEFTVKPDDPETVHQLRVRIRSLRSILSFIKPLLDQKQYRTIQQRLRSLLQLTGYLRELDVLISEWVDFALERGAQEDALMNILKIEREKAKVDSCEKVSAVLLPTIFDIWNWVDKELSGKKMKAETTSQNTVSKMISFRDFSDMRLNSWIKKLNKGMSDVDLSDDKSIHALRIQVKKLRYVLYYLNAQIDVTNKTDIEFFKNMQKLLGDYCDAKRGLSILVELGAKYRIAGLERDIETMKDCQRHISEEKLAEIGKNCQLMVRKAT